MNEQEEFEFRYRFEQEQKKAIPVAKKELKAPTWVGGPEAALSMVAGIPSQIAGGLYGLGTLLSGQGIDKAGDAVRSIQEGNFGVGSYQGTSEQGKAATQKLGEWFSKPGEVGGDVGAYIGKQLGNEDLGRLAGQLPVDTAMNFLPLHLGVTLPIKGVVKGAEMLGRKKPPSLEERLQQAHEQQKPVVPVEPQPVVAPTAPDFTLEHPIAADNRVAAINKRQPSAEDFNNRDANVNAVQEEIAAFEQARAADAQAALDAEQAGTHAFLRDAQQTVIDDHPHGDVPAQFGATLEHGRVDDGPMGVGRDDMGFMRPMQEHGMPIRADLSMEAQNLQNPLQRNLWGDELPGLTGDNGPPLTQALDRMPHGPERDTAIKQLQHDLDGGILPKANVSGGSADLSPFQGMSRGQRGAIDLGNNASGESPASLEALGRLVEEGKLGRARAVIKQDGTVQPLIGVDAVDYRPRPGEVVVQKNIGNTPWTILDSNGVKNPQAQLNRGMSRGQRGGFDYEILPKSFRDFVDNWKKAGGNLSHVGVSRMLDDHPVSLTQGNRELLASIYPETARTYQEKIDKAWLQSDPDKAARWGKRYDDALVAEAVLKQHDAFNTGFTLDGPRYDAKTGRYAGKVAAQEQADATINMARRKGQSGAIDPEMLTRGLAKLVPGMKAKQDIISKAISGKLFAESPTAEGTIAAALQEGKDGKGSINFSAGGSLEAVKRNSALIQGGVRILQREKNLAEDQIRTTVFPTETAFRKLPIQGLVDLVTSLKVDMFNRAELGADTLAGLGFNEKQLIARQKLRDMQKAALDDQNSVRALQGLAPVTEGEAYMASRWQGDFRRAIHNKDGKLVWQLAADNKFSLDQQTKKLIAKFPEEYGGHTDSVVKSSKGGTDAQAIYTAMLDVLGRDDPAVARIKAWVEETTIGEGRATLGQEKHFEPKANVRGFVGDRPWNNPKDEALAYIQQQINYAKNAHKWAGIQRAGLEMKKIFSDGDIQAQQPNNVKYLREYWADNVGFNETKGIRGLEDDLRSLGMSPNQLGRGVSSAKNLWVGQKLVFNAGFYAANAIQAGNIFPHLVDLRHTYGGNPITATALGIPLGLLMATGHSLKTPGFFYKTLGILPKEGEFIARAMKYAEDNSVIARSIYDESPVQSSFGIKGRLGTAARITTSLPETYLRGVSYMTYVSMLRDSGKFKNDLDLFRIAEEKVNISMADYREGERAPIFNKLGNVGNALNVLQTFPMNYYNQWSWAIREAARKNPGPAIAMLATQGYMAGAMGVPGFAQIDQLIELGKDALSETAPLVWNKIKNFSLKRAAIDLGGASLLYGLLSEQTEVGLTSRASAPIPSEMIQTPGAPAIELAGQVGSVLSAAGSGFTDSQKNAQALYNIAPSGLQGALETGPLKEFVASPRKNGTTLYDRPKDMAAREGTYARTPEEESLRMKGFRSQKEAVTRDLEYYESKEAKVAADVLRKLPGTIYNKLRNNDAEAVKDYVKLYVSLSGKPLTSQQIKSELVKEFTTIDERNKMRKTQTIEQLLAIKRLDQTLRDMGYAN